MSFAKILPLFILIAFVVFGASFMPLILGAVEEGQSTNLSIDYQNQINGTRDASLVTIGFTKYLSTLLGVVVLVIAVIWIGRRK